MQQDDDLAGPTNDFFVPGNFEMNPTKPKRRLHAIMSDIATHADCLGRYHFRMVWPGLGFYNEWFQTSDPTTSYTVTGFQGECLQNWYLQSLTKQDILLVFRSSVRNSNQVWDWFCGPTQTQRESRVDLTDWGCLD